MNRTQRRAAIALVTTATISIGGLVASLGTAGATLTLPPIPTTTIDPTSPVSTIQSILHPTTTTQPPAPTTSTPATTTSTTQPSQRGDGTGSTSGGTGTSSSSGTSSTGTAGQLEMTLQTGAAPTAGNGVDNALPTVADALAAIESGQPLPVAVTPSAGSVSRSPVYASPAGVDASFTLPPAGRSTAALFDVLFGMDLSPSALARLLAPFPVAGKATYNDDWQAPRFTPTAHLHEGTDVFAARGTPVVAAADGVLVRQANSSVGGNAIHLSESDGTYYYYAHLDRFVATQQDGQRVNKGDVIGFVGTTGNAEGNAPHLHFEIHPKGGDAVNPAPYLDRWLTEALATASTLRSLPGAADSIVTLRPAHGKGKAAGGSFNGVLRRASSERPLPPGTTLDPASGLEISAVALFLLWMFRRFRRRLIARRAP